jgi:hypothetical protein
LKFFATRENSKFGCSISGEHTASVFRVELASVLKMEADYSMEVLVITRQTASEHRRKWQPNTLLAALV